MTERLKIISVYGISVLFIAVNLYAIVEKNFYWMNLAPVILLIGILYFVSLDKILFLVALLTPVAVNFRNFELGVGISLPTEPLLLGVLVFFLLKLFFDGKYDVRALRHPVTLAILFNLVWILFTSITSELPLVSFKFLLARLWFVVPFYFIAVLMFKEKSNIKTFVWLYVSSLIIVIVYTIIRHIGYGLDEDSGHWVMRPFYNDHTAYGAVLALFLPVLIGFTLMKNHTSGVRLISAVVSVIFIAALVLSYSRAAWLSAAAALAVLVVVLLKIRFRWIFLSFVIVLGLFLTFQQQILDRLEKNEQETSANFVEHVQSITNISSNASNLERINRWQSALRMFDERPFWGWGPGTYQFLYAPFQMSQEKTIISTNAGDLGNAHSEYIGPLAESGLIGMLSFMLIAVLTLFQGFRIYNSKASKEIRILGLSVTLGLVTYFVHGFLNNFLDSDKASVPFWGFVAILIALRLYHFPHEKTQT